MVAACAVLALYWRTSSTQLKSTVHRFANSPDVSTHTGPMMFFFGPLGLSSHSASSSNWYSWEVVADIDETETHLFIYVGSYRAFILPRAECDSSQSWDQLVATIRTLRSTAKNYLPQCPRCSFDLSGIPVEGCPECGWKRGAPFDGACV